jgi:hypothetical protein
MDLHLRIHQEAVDPTELKKFLQDYCECWYWVLETQAARPHHQLYLKSKPKYKSVNSLRNSVKKIIRVEYQGNKAYSLSECRGDESDDPPDVVLVCYLMKEGNVIESRNMYVNVIKAAEARQNVIKAAIAERKVNKKGSVLQRLLDEIQYPPTEPMTDRALAEAIVKWFMEQKRLIPDQYMLRKYIVSIQMVRDPSKLKPYVENILQMWDPWNFNLGT